MKKVTSNESLAYVGHLKNVMEQSGIGCVIKNAQLSGGAGEIPPLECVPELWVLDNDDLDRAKVLLAELEQPADPAPQWRCRGCGEVIDGQFIVCWNCGVAAEDD